MSEALLPTEPSLDDEVAELRAFGRSCEFLTAVDRHLDDPVTCHNCQRDLEGRGVCFLRIEDEVRPVCYGCVAEIE
jgi:hypothetical protein